MRLFRNLLILLFVFCSVCFSQNHYDLTVGTTRYYDGAQEYSWLLLGTYRGIEKIIGDTLIDSKTYSIIKWKAEWIPDMEDEVIFYKDTSFYRFNDGLLLKYTSDGDSVVQNYAFSIGDSICNFYLEQDLASFKSYPPSLIIYDTISTFTDDSKHRIIWGDDTTHFYMSPTTIIPDKQTFMDSILIDRGETWLLPFGATQTYAPYRPFYFIDSLGILYSEWNYRKMAMVGVKKADGTLYGQEVDFITNIDSRSSKLKGFELYQNYPNPFNPKTQISFYMQVPGKVTITVFNTIGQKVSTLFEGIKTAGLHSLTFNADGLSSGLYFYMIETNRFTSTKKMLYVR